MSHGDRIVATAARVSGASASRPTRLSRLSPTKARALLRPDVPPRSRPHARRRPVDREFRPRRRGPSKRDWTMAAFRAEAAAKKSARRSAGARVICGLSGGVDSSVAAVLIHEALGDQLTCVFVDHGLMRTRARATRSCGCSATITTSRSSMWRRPRSVSRRELKGVSRSRDQAQDDWAPVHRDLRARGGANRRPTGAARSRFLAQGTLYPDVIESVSFTGGPSVTIKSHHNVGGLPERMNMKLVEPLRELFKDEVRESGAGAWACPPRSSAAIRSPVPGLAIRIPGEITRRKARYPAPGRRHLSGGDSRGRAL